MIKALVVSALLFGSVASAEPLMVRPPDSCGTPQVRGPLADEKVAAAPGVQRVIWLNRFGGNYMLAAGATDSSQNIANANIVSQRGTAAITIAPMENDFDWTAVRDCVVNHYKPYNVRIVETRPESGNYVQAVVGGTGTELGFPVNQLFGIASADNFCNVTEKGIAFSFSTTHEQVPQKNDELCATIAHEVGHLLALEHEVTPTDLLSYVLVSQSGSKTFVNGDAQCGTTPQQTNACSCSASSTNSSMRLNQFVGAKPADANPPTLSVNSPSNDDTVGPDFLVKADATDGEGMADVLVLVDGVELGNDATPDGKTYTVTAKGATEGKHTLTVVARDLGGNTTKKDLSITVAKLGLGEDCVDSGSCAANLCAQTSDGKFCTQKCDASTACPDNFSCDNTAMVCVPADGGGCCSADGHAGASALFAFGVGALLVRRRRS